MEDETSTLISLKVPSVREGSIVGRDVKQHHGKGCNGEVGGADQKHNGCPNGFSSSRSLTGTTVQPTIVLTNTMMVAKE